jgi:hypothetical protein
MTDNPDDFSPIGEQGTLEVEKKGFIRRSQWTPVSAQPGRAIIFQTKSGDYTEMHADSTAGERLFANPTSWVEVDIAPHTLTYEIPFKDPTGSRGFIASVSVESQIIDAPAAVKDGARSVKAYVLPALETIVAGVGEQVTPAATEGAPVLVGDALAQAQARLRTIVNQEIEELPAWLRTQIRSAQVDLDAVTKEHHARIVGEQHTGEVTEMETIVRRHQDAQRHADELAETLRKRELEQKDRDHADELEHRRRAQQHADEIADRLRRRDLVALDQGDRELADELEHHRQLRVLRRTAELAGLEREFGAIESTAAHEQDLLELERAGKRAMLESANRYTGAEQQLKFQELWRTALAPVLTTPSSRRIEPFIMDPTTENLQRVVGELEAADQRGWHDILVLLQQLVDKGLVDVDDPIYHTIKELVSTLPGYPAILSAPLAPKAIDQTDAEPAIEGHAVEGETTAADADATEDEQQDDNEPPADGKSGDTSW